MIIEHNNEKYKFCWSWSHFIDNTFPQTLRHVVKMSDKGGKEIFRIAHLHVYI